MTPRPSLRHPKTTIIWAHVGLGHIVDPVRASAESAERNPSQIAIVEAMLTDSALSHVSFDISWDEVAKYAVATPASITRVAGMLSKYPDRFLFGTDTVAPAGPAPYYAVFETWAPIWRLLTPEASLKVCKGNFERMFDEGRRRSARLGSGNLNEVQLVSKCGGSNGWTCSESLCPGVPARPGRACPGNTGARAVCGGDPAGG